ncbi:uncharacterized protein B0H64DRAFT_475298 [Chaetomium fimeti]|uniref:C2H2-type domain-containing protein n=1 Tax=Chaetomium fimeti TaxID=1854472 RepID=A0AAE0LSU6_9PEZI|nr:hypothetical protein B0H64DRAFT_475298 [Chaetomium fimeti]
MDNVAPETNGPSSERNLLANPKDLAPIACYLRHCTMTHDGVALSTQDLTSATGLGASPAAPHTSLAPSTERLQVHALLQPLPTLPTPNWGLSAEKRQDFASPPFTTGTASPSPALQIPQPAIGLPSTPVGEPFQRLFRDEGDEEHMGQGVGRKRLRRWSETSTSPSSAREVDPVHMETAKLSLGSEYGQLSCPYRKRNKARFNLRNYPKCSKPFRNIGLLKFHVRESHAEKIVYSCPRCWLRFGSHTDMKRHQADQSCVARPWPQWHARSRDVEDGIDTRTASLLIERKSPYKVSTWEELWRTLFPDDAEVPSPNCEPCVEACEFISVSREALLLAQERLPEPITGILEKNRCLVVKPSNLTSQLVEVMGSVLEDCLAQALGDFEHAISLGLPPKLTSSVPRPGESPRHNLLRDKHSKNERKYPSKLLRVLPDILPGEEDGAEGASLVTGETKRRGDSSGGTRRISKADVLDRAIGAIQRYLSHTGPQ